MKNSINIKTQNTEYVLNFNNVLNVIVGEPSTSKTNLFEILSKKLYDSVTHTFTDIHCFTDWHAIGYYKPGSILIAYLEE